MTTQNPLENKRCTRVLATSNEPEVPNGHFTKKIFDSNGNPIDSNGNHISGIIDSNGNNLSSTGDTNGVNNSAAGNKASLIETTGASELLALLDDTLVRDLNIDSMSRSELMQLQRLLTPKMTKYIPHVPTPKQAAFLLLDNREAFYGGAAGGGKSDALLMAGLQYVDVKGYAGIIFRKTYADLTKPGALIERAKEWLLPHSDIRWDEKNKRFEFQEKFGKRTEVRSILQFGYLESPNDRYNYQGGEYQFVGFDELTHIDMDSYLYLFSRLRRLKGSKIPLRVRSASNPPDSDRGLWVKKRFIDEGQKYGRVFIPAGLEDNPYLDRAEYEESLQELDPVTRRQLRDGDWDIVRRGNMFKRDWFQIVDVAPKSHKKLRFWDMAASDPEQQKRKKKSSDPDYTVGLLMSEHRGIFYIEDIIRARKRPADTELIQKYTAVADGYGVLIREEQEPGASGIASIDQKARTIFLGYSYEGVRSTGSKATRAMGVSSAAERGQIKIVKGCRYVDELFQELEQFPGGAHDDLVDALAGAYTELAQIPVITMPVTVEDEYSNSYWIDEEASGPGYFSNVRSLVGRGGR